MTDEQRHTLQKALAGLEKSELIGLLLDQAERLEKLEQEVQKLQGDLTTALRANKRQAAPFGKSREELKPRRGGRKKGHKGSYRQPSAEPDEEEEACLDCCPQCGGPVQEVKPVEQIIEELPPIQPRVVRLRTYRGQCPSCGTVHSRHPLQVGHATGSAKVQLGPRAISKVLELRHHYGLSTRKSCDLLEACFGLPLSPGAVCQLEQRMAGKLLPDYEQLRQQARQADLIHCDETSWYVGRPGWWLWVLTNEDMTLYEVSRRRSKEVLENMLGETFNGVLVSDCLSVYEHFCEAQQKCYAHHLKAIGDAIKAYPDSSFLKLVRKLLQKAIGYGACRDHFEPPDFQRLCSHLEQRTDQLLPTFQDENGNFHFAENECPFDLQETELKVARRIAKRRQHLFTFLYHEKVPATNNLAERQLRPAVIQRKISCGNKTPKGAKAWKIIRSLETTSLQNGKDFADSVLQAIQRSL